MSGMILKKSFDFFKQIGRKDCGSTCLRMIAKHYNRDISLSKLRFLSETTRDGTEKFSDIEQELDELRFLLEKNKVRF